MAFGLFASHPAIADELVVHDAGNLNRTGRIELAYKFDRPVTGHGRLVVEWDDVLGRVVERRHLPLDIASGNEVPFALDAKLAVATVNLVKAWVSLGTAGPNGERLQYNGTATAQFTIPPTGDPWADYQIIMWQEQTSAGYAALKRIGVTAGAVSGHAFLEDQALPPQPITALVGNNLQFYLENIATDFYSAYHRWFPDHAVNWRFKEIKEQYFKDPQDLGALMRDPSLSDQKWLNRIRQRLEHAVRTLRPFRPLFYNLADEPGIADLSAFWDFDLSPASLSGMRDWLKARYGSLAQLNHEWGSSFANWDAVVPMTTPEAIGRKDQNFAAWADFKEWMDTAFARAVKTGTDAVHIADPAALSAIEGGQIPGWGGWDYARLVHAVDLMELYDYGDNIEIVRSLNPRMVIVTSTSSRNAAGEEHLEWRELLRGTRGLILWDASHQFAGEDGSLGERAREAKSYYQEFRSGLGALLINSQRHYDPIAILYSPASMRVEWLLDRIASGEDWTKRNAKDEYADNRSRVSIRNAVRAIEHMGLQQRFITAEAVERGELETQGIRVLILPWSMALSDRAVEKIREFVADGGTVVADGEPAVFDEHGRRREHPALEGMPLTRLACADVPAARRIGRDINLAVPVPRDCAAEAGVSAIIARAGLGPRFPVTGEDGKPRRDVETYLFSDGGVTIVGLLRDEMTECTSSAASSQSNGLEPAVLHLPDVYEVYDLRARRSLGRRSQVNVELGSTGAVILALSKERLPSLSIAGPERVRPGEVATFRIAPTAASKLAFDVVHVEVTDPAGNIEPYYSRNMLARSASASIELPVALNAKPGIWHVRATDLPGGRSVAAAFTVTEPSTVSAPRGERPATGDRL